MSNMLGVSIIVPIYNVEKYLNACVDSLLEQTFTDFEIILVDDGSTDRCGQICDEYAEKDSRIKVIHKDNQGLGAARNSGIDIAQGKYLYFIDSDDLLHPQAIELLYTMAENESADMVLCHYDFFEGQYKNNQYINISKECRNYDVLDKDELLHNYSKHCGKVSLISMCMKLYSKHIFENYRVPAVRLHEDSLALPYTIELSDKIIKTNLKLYHWRNTPGSLSRSNFNIKEFMNIDIPYYNAQFFMKRKNKVQANFFKKEFLNRTLKYYYKIPAVDKDFYEAFKPYMKKYKKSFIRFWFIRGMCIRERIAYLLFLFSPKSAKRLYMQYIGEK